MGLASQPGELSFPVLTEVRGPSGRPVSVGRVRALLIAGTILEFFGIMVVAWPDLLPYGERLSSWLGRVYLSAYERTADLMRRFSRRPRGGTVHVRSGTVTTGGGVTGRAAIEPGSAMEEQVAYLLKRDQDVQAMFDSLSAQVVAGDRRAEEGLSQVRIELKGHVATEMSRYRALRALGTGLLAAGLACTVAAGIV